MQVGPEPEVAAAAPSSSSPEPAATGDPEPPLPEPAPPPVDPEENRRNKVLAEYRKLLLSHKETEGKVKSSASRARSHWSCISC